MAIKVERYEDSVDLIRTYSDIGMMIRQDSTGILYEEAIDPDYTNRTYTETDIPIHQDEEESESEPEPDDGFLKAQAALDIIFGGAP